MAHLLHIDPSIRVEGPVSRALTARVPIRLVLVGLAALGALLGLSTLGAAGALATSGKSSPPSKQGVVFVQTDGTGGNRVSVFDRASDGSLTAAGSYATGGLGGRAAGEPPGMRNAALASQGSLVYDSGRSMLFAVNAGSNSVSAFEVQGDKLHLTDVVSSGGGFPDSLTVHGNLLYVLDAGGAGTVQGFRIADSHQLVAIPGSARNLGLANSDPPNFLTSPGQIGFSPDGRQLLVVTKASDNNIDVFSVSADGRLSAAPRVNASATPVPFSFTFDLASGRLVVAETGQSDLSTYTLGSDGSLTDPHSLSDGQIALCWVTRVGGFYYVSNTDSNTLSGYTLGTDGAPALMGATGIVATTETGPIDSAASSDARFLYLETGAGTLDTFAVTGDGSLSKLGAISIPLGSEGIAAT